MNKALIVFLSFLISSCFASPQPFFFTASIHSTILSVAIPHSALNSSLLAIETNLPVLSKPLISTDPVCPAKHFDQFHSQSKYPSPLYSLSHCIFLKFPLSFRSKETHLSFSTSLGTLPDSLSLNISTLGFSLFSNEIKNHLNLVETSELFRPLSEISASRHHSAFLKNDIYFKFRSGYGLNREAYPQGMMWILTLPRSGTHFLKETIEKVMEEYTTIFPQPTFRPPQIPLDRPFKFTRFSVSHYAFNELLTSRLVLVYRNPVSQADSFFHQTVNRVVGCHESNRVEDGYEKLDAFKEYMKNGVNLVRNFNREHFFIPFTKYFARFEDIVYEPETILCEMLSFMTAVPCEFTFKEKLKGILKDEGLISNYKKEKPRKEPVSNRGMFEKMGKEIVQLFWDSNEVREWIYFMDYQKEFLDFLGNVKSFRTKTAILEDGNFRNANKKSLHEVLFYEHEYRILIDEEHISGIDPAPVLAREIIIQEDFKKFRKCHVKEGPFIKENFFGGPNPPDPSQKNKRPKSLVDRSQMVPEPPHPLQKLKMDKHKPKKPKRKPNEGVGYEKPMPEFPRFNFM